jgi:hypothetical protein
MAEEMERVLNRQIAHVPDIQANIFFQFKRSEYMINKTATEWPHWNQAYYRYEIYEEQQVLLEALHASFSSDVLILYAAPLAQDVSQLVDFHLSGKIIRNTNFRPAHELVGHRRNTFLDPGSHSWACSDPVRLEPFDFEGAIARIKLSQIEAVPAISRVASTIERIVLDSPFRLPFQNLSERYLSAQIFNDLPLLRTYITMAIFRELTGIQWTVVTR